MPATNSWLGPDGQCASIAGSRGVFCEKGLRGPVAPDPQGDSYVQQLACEEDRPFSRYLLNRAGRDCAAAHEQKPLDLGLPCTVSVTPPCRVSRLANLEPLRQGGSLAWLAERPHRAGLGLVGLSPV